MNDIPNFESGKLCQSHNNAKRFVRVPAFDRRIARGDDFAGDAWLDKASGQVVYSAVGRDRNVSIDSDQSQGE
jgi:hypothetical protein